MPAGIPGGAIARGSIFSVFGAHLGPVKPVTASSFPLGTALGNVSINVIQGSTTVNAIPVYVSASQINAIMPSNAPLGAVSLQVVSSNARGNLSPARVASSAFGIFTATGTGIGPGVLYNFVAQDNQPVNSPTITAKRGQVITLWGTGLGPVTGTRQCCAHGRQSAGGGRGICRRSAGCGAIQRPKHMLCGRGPNRFHGSGQCPARLLGAGLCTHWRYNGEQCRQHGDKSVRRRL